MFHTNDSKTNPIVTEEIVPLINQCNLCLRIRVSLVDAENNVVQLGVPSCKYEDVLQIASGNNLVVVKGYIV